MRLVITVPVVGAIVGVGVIVVVALLATNLIRFSPFTATEFLQHLAPLFLVTLIVERTVETLVLWCDRHRAENQARSMRVAASSILGASLAILGIRALGIFVDPGEFQDLRGLQRHLFHAVDIVLTTGFIAGASNGFHQVISFLDALTEGRKSTKRRRARRRRRR